MEGAEKKESNSIFQHNQSKFNKGTQPLIYLSEEDSNRKEIFSILIKTKSGKKQTQNQRKKTNVT